MITSETGVWKHLQSKVRSKGHFTRIESGMTVLGQPDVNYCVDGEEGNLELKYCRGTTDGFELRPAQYQWMKRRIKAGGFQIWILAHIGQDNTWILVHGSHAEKCIKNPKKWLDYATRTWHGNFSAEELVELISMKP